MKTKFKLYFLTLTILFFSTFLIISCSNDSETNQNLSKNAKIDKYLKSFYSSNYQLGESTEAKEKNNLLALSRTEEFNNILVTEVFIGNDTRARGYIITSKETDDIKYFIDVNRIDYKLTSVDFEQNSTNFFEQINLNENYIISDEFDLIKIFKDPNIIIVTNPGYIYTVQGTQYSYGSCFNGVRGVYKAYFLFKIQWTDWTPVLDDDNHHITVGCNETYNPN